MSTLLICFGVSTCCYLEHHDKSKRYCYYSQLWSDSALWKTAIPGGWCVTWGMQALVSGLLFGLFLWISIGENIMFWHFSKAVFLCTRLFAWWYHSNAHFYLYDGTIPTLLRQNWGSYWPMSITTLIIDFWHHHLIYHVKWNLEEYETY